MAFREASSETAAPEIRAPGEPRSFLFLQGPVGNFFDRLARALMARGHRVHHVDLNLGDQIFWRLPATHFRGRFEAWRGFIARELEAHAVTDLILFGDRRPHHLVAAEEARARGIAVVCTEQGYLRPDWLTLEHDGMSTFSRLPRDRETVERLAAVLPAPDLEPRFHTPFRLLATLDVAYNVAEVLGRPLYPHYRRHVIWHPFAEYAGWVGALARRRLRRRAIAAAREQLAAAPGSYFLFSLQLATDYQIRAHSPYADLRDAVREAVASFARSGSPFRLVVTIHPLDNGLIPWRRLVMAEARRRGAADRVSVLDGGTPPPLLGNAAGIVTVNSTIGIAALRLGVPVKVLGNAVFDVPGVTSCQPLDGFWRDPQPPDRKLVDDLVRVLAHTTQVRGGYYEPRSQQHAIDAVVERLERGLYPLPPPSSGELARRAPRPVGRTVAVTAAAGRMGSALARALAAPGTRLCLIAGSAERLAEVARDCRLRGALVDTAAVEPGDDAALAAQLADFDRRAPIDLLIACAEGGDPEEARGPQPAWLAHRRVERDLLGAMAAIEAIAERMRRRRRGRIVIVDSFALASPPDDMPAYQACRAGILAYASWLRRRLRPSLVGVSIAAPGALAARVLAGRALSGGVAPDPERIAIRLRRAIERGRDTIHFPSPLRVGLYALALVPPFFGEFVKATLLPTVEPVGEPDEPSVLSGEPSNSSD